MNMKLHKLTPEELDALKKALGVDVEGETKVTNDRDPDEGLDEHVKEILEDLEDIEGKAIRLADRAQDITGDCLDGIKHMSGGTNRILYGMAYHCFVTMTDLAHAIHNAAEFVREHDRDD